MVHFQPRRGDLFIVSYSQSICSSIGATYYEITLQVAPMELRDNYSHDHSINRSLLTELAHYIALAASTTSSMPPLRKNACSGMSSCFPAMISLKPRIVSSIGTN